MSSSTSKQLQNDIVNLFCNQQKSLTSANRKTQYMFSLLDALMLNSHANAHKNKNTINLRNVNSQQKEQTQAIVKFKEMKKRKAMKSSQKEASIEVSTSKCYDVISKKMQIKRLRERIEFAVNQLEVFSIRCMFRFRAHLTLLLSSFFKNQLQIQYDFN